MIGRECGDHHTPSRANDLSVKWVAPQTIIILMRKFPLVLVLLTLVSACSSEVAETTEATAPTAKPATQAEALSAESLKSQLAANLPGVPIDAVSATPIKGVYEIRSGLTFGYVSADGRYLIAGDLNDLSTGESLTEIERRGLRHDMLAKFDGDNSILYSPAEPAKHTVTVFTDIDCGYCRKLHQHIAEYNRDGIAVRYLFFPRSGPGTESFAKAEKVWCAKDRNAALTQAKLGGGFEGDNSCETPIHEQFNLGAELGVRGTPAIFLPDGQMVPGYRTPEQLLSDLGAVDPADAG